jgi:P4 family phage/plasmid primase-like protien
MTNPTTFEFAPQPSVLSVGGEIHSLALRCRKNKTLREALILARAMRDDYAQRFNVVLSDDAFEKAVYLAYDADPAAQKLDFADGVLSQAFVATNPDLRFVAESEDWYEFNNGIWVQGIDPRQQVATFLQEQEPKNLTNPKVQQNIHKELYSTKKLSAVLFQVKYHPSLLVSETDFDRDPMLLGLPNGQCLDLRDGSTRKTTREDLISKVMPCAPAPEGAKCDRWEEFQKETHDDGDVIRFLKEWFGVCLTADTSADLLLFLIGLAGAGKGTTIKPLLTLLGSYAMPIGKVMLLAGGDEARRDNYLAQLRGKRLAVCGEGDKVKRYDANILKMLTGGDHIQARRLGHDPISFAPSHKVCVLSNSEPVLDVDDGIRRRVVVIPFRNVPQVKDETLRDYFCSPDVLPFIFRWAIDGCLRWQSAKKKLVVPESVKVRTAEYLENADLLGGFINERVEDAPGHFMPTSQLYAAWCGYCDLEQQDLKGSLKSFVADIERRKPQWVPPGDNRRRINGGQQRCFVGIRLVAQIFDGKAA